MAGDKCTLNGIEDCRLTERAGPLSRRIADVVPDLLAARETDVGIDAVRLIVFLEK